MVMMPPQSLLDSGLDSNIYTASGHRMSAGLRHSHPTLDLQERTKLSATRAADPLQDGNVSDKPAIIPQHEALNNMTCTAMS
jgi:hypothetical protein